MYTHDPLPPSAHTDDHAEEGWYALRRRTSRALTHYAAPAPEGDQDAQWHRAAHWALLPAELAETADTLEISLEAPGMTPEQFDIAVVEGILLIRGHKPLEESPPETRFFLRERAYGSFERAFHLPAAIDDGQATACYRQGILRISLPKMEPAGETRVVVEGGE